MPSQTPQRLSVPFWLADAALAAAVAALGAARLAGGPQHYGRSQRATVMILVAMGLVLFFRRRFPGAVLAAVTLLAAGLVALRASPPGALMVVIIAAYSAALHGSRGLARGSVWTAMGIGAATAIATVTGVEGWLRANLPLTDILAAAGAAVAGFAIRNEFSLCAAQLDLLAERDELIAERQQEELQRVRLAERMRIARELHDIVAHHISVVIIQAQSAQRQAEADPARAKSVMAEVERTGRTALEEMRRLVGVLRSGELAAGADVGADQAHDTISASGEAGTAGIADITGLAERMRAAGLEVTLTTTGTPPQVPDDVGLAAYRIVQEALTNALKHAHAARVTVRLDFSEGIDITVFNDGHAQRARLNGAPIPGAGRGLTGMAERAAAAGGRLTAGPHADGGFEVHATIPLQAS